MFHDELDTHTDIDIANEAATVALAVKIVDICGVGDMVALYGTLGVGKTVFARAFIRARAGQAEEVPSPTFTLVQHYECDPVPIYHFDLYRLSGEDDLEALGAEEYFYGFGICLVEWAERAGDLLPAKRVEVEFEHLGDDERRIVISRLEP